MLLYFMPLLDIMSTILIVLIHFEIFGLKAALFAGIYLMGKGFIFITDPASRIDLAIGIFVFFIYAGFHSFLTWIAVAYLLQKALLAFIHWG